MIKIQFDQKHLEFAKVYAEKQTIGGFSNLKSFDLKKASRYSFQITGVLSEAAFYLHRYGSIDRLKDLLDLKFETLRPKKKGDGGHDDDVKIGKKTRLIDIKGSHTDDPEKIQRLNLVIPEREFHENMIYVAAFTVGKERETPDYAILQGWEFSENITDRWHYDKNKWCVKVPKLKDMKELNKYIGL
jgi:hypothetical protein